MGRVAALTEGTGTDTNTNTVTLEGYKYLGLGMIVEETHPQTGVNLTYVKQGSESVGDAGDQPVHWPGPLRPRRGPALPRYE